MLKTNLTQLLVALSLFLVVSGTNAQSFFSENFEGAVGANGLPAGWTQVISPADSQGWRVGTAAAAASQYFSIPASSRFAYINDDDCNCDMANERLIMPAQNFSAYTAVSLSFNYYSQQYYGSEWDVEVSTNGGSSWTVVYTDGANTTGWSNKTVNLSAYAGQASVTIAFKYRDAAAWAGGLGIDDVALSQSDRYDLAIGLPYEDPNGWTLEYGRITGYQYMPQSQIKTNELFAGATVFNRGTQNATGVYVRLNIDRVGTGGTFTNVLTDTFNIGTILPDSTEWAYGDLTDSTWTTPGTYRYQYIIKMDSTDAKPTSDTITDFFNITGNFWSKVNMANDGGPFGDNAYLPGVTAPNFISLMEWGTMYYFPKGANYVLDTMTVRLFSASSATATSGTYQARIYKIVDGNANNQFDDILVDKSLSAIVSDTVAITGGTNVVRRLSNFLDINTFAEFEFEDDEIYYITVYQQNSVAPGLNNGTVRNGFYVYGEGTNHDAYVYGNGSNFQFYNPLIIQESNATTPTAYEYGWTGGPEPSIFLNLRSTVTSVNEVNAELSGVEVYPNPVSTELSVNVNLESASDVRYILTDMSGRVIDIKFASDVTSEQRTFNVANFPAGMYMLHVKANGMSTSKKFIKK